MKMNKMYYCVMSLEHVLQMLLFKDIYINQNKPRSCQTVLEEPGKQAAEFSISIYPQRNDKNQTPGYLGFTQSIQK